MQTFNALIILDTKYDSSPSEAVNTCVSLLCAACTGFSENRAETANKRIDKAMTAADLTSVEIITLDGVNTKNYYGIAFQTYHQDPFRSSSIPHSHPPLQRYYHILLSVNSARVAYPDRSTATLTRRAGAHTPRPRSMMMTGVRRNIRQVEGWIEGLIL